MVLRARSGVAAAEAREAATQKLGARREEAVGAATRLLRGRGDGAGRARDEGRGARAGAGGQA